MAAVGRYRRAMRRSAYLGGSDVFDRAITQFASASAGQNERDYRALREAVASGRVTAKSDV